MLLNEADGNRIHINPDMAKYKIAFLISHPIQYFSPLFKDMTGYPRIDLTVLYCSDESIRGMQDIGFARQVKWDLPLLEGYKYKFLKNYSLFPGVACAPFGLMNFGIILELLQNNYDAAIIHGWHYFTYWIVFLTCLLSRRPFFIRSELPLNQEIIRPKWKIAIKKILLGLLFRKAKGLLAIGSENRAFYKFYNAKEDKIYMTPYTVDNKRLMEEYDKFNEEKNEELRKDIGISKEDVVVVFVGKFIAKKRPIDLLKAYEKIKTDKKALIFVGDGKLRNSLENYTKEKGLEKVYFVGFKNQTELPKYYAMADIFVLPSGVGETWGLAVNEAMCFNLPILVSDLVGCGKDLVKYGKNGFIFRTGDVKELADYLEKLIKDSNLRREMGEESFEIIRNWDYQSDIRGIMKAMEAL